MSEIEPITDTEFDELHVVLYSRFFRVAKFAFFWGKYDLVRFIFVLMCTTQTMPILIL